MEARLKIELIERSNPKWCDLYPALLRDDPEPQEGKMDSGLRRNDEL
jgi:hypothetical protein